jgi:hypothetical protein
MVTSEGGGKGLALSPQRLRRSPLEQVGPLPPVLSLPLRSRIAAISIPLRHGSRFLMVGFF